MALAPAKPLFSYRPFWAKRFGPAPFLPTTRAEMEQLGWGECDVIIVTGDAYVDHPSFGMAIIGRLLEAQGFRVGIISQPDWRTSDPFAELGKPALFFGVTGGNMDSMVNRYTSDRKRRSDDAYTPAGEGGKRPDRSVLVYSQRCREAFPDTPIIIGGIEASLRRIAHYDYWQDRVRQSLLADAQADLLVFGNGERSIVEIAHRLARREPIASIRDVRGTAFLTDAPREGFAVIDSTTVDGNTTIATPPINPYLDTTAQPDATCATAGAASAAGADLAPTPAPKLVQLKGRRQDPSTTAIRLPSFDDVRKDPLRYAHASRVLHLEANPGNARALIQRHGNVDVWINPPPIPLTTPEMDGIYELPYQRVPHPSYEGKIPAFEMIKHSVTIMRGCFGGCSFCSITEHEGRIIQNRSEKSILSEIEQIRDTSPGFTGVISDIGGPTANMWRLACKSRDVESSCRKPSCVYPDICDNLQTDHSALVELYRKARALPGIKKILIASGVRYDLAVRSPAWIEELAKHHTGGYLKIAPEHTEEGPLRHMMKPGIGAFDKFKAIFDRAGKAAGKEQYLIPYFIAAHPGTSDMDMLNLALWLKRNGFRADQVQAFLPGPMASASTMYHTGYNPLRSLKAAETVEIVKDPEQRRLHKAFLRYHDANNWPVLRAALVRMGRADLIGNSKHHLIPTYQPLGTGDAAEGRRGPRGAGGSRGASEGQAPGAQGTKRLPHHVVARKGPRRGAMLTQHTGLPPRRSS